jgi:hypothetical protein
MPDEKHIEAGEIYWHNPMIPKIVVIMPVIACDYEQCRHQVKGKCKKTTCHIQLPMKCLDMER